MRKTRYRIFILFAQKGLQKKIATDLIVQLIPFLTRIKILRTENKWHSHSSCRTTKTTTTLQPNHLRRLLSFRTNISPTRKDPSWNDTPHSTIHPHRLNSNNKIPPTTRPPNPKPKMESSHKTHLHTPHLIVTYDKIRAAFMFFDTGTLTTLKVDA